MLKSASYVSPAFCWSAGSPAQRMCVCRLRDYPGAGENVRAQLSTIQSDEVTPDRRFRARVDDAIREGLKALGYYEPTIEFDLRPPPKRDVRC